MYSLTPGIESKERILLLLQLTEITSEDIIAALVDHLERGLSVTTSAALNNVPQPNVSRALATLNEKAEIVEKIKEHDERRRKQYQLTDIKNNKENSSGVNE
jgi:DNA-binding MarR family transcriptional regulator